MNQSAPKTRSVNDFIDKSAYPSTMGGIPQILRGLDYCGRKAKIAKADWNNAYKVSNYGLFSFSRVSSRCSN